MPSIPRFGNVYLLRMDGTSYYKVGVSIGDVQMRIAALQTGNPHTLTVISTHEQADPYNVEQFIHAALRLYGVRNEWFCGDEEVIRSVFEVHNAMATIDAQLSQTKPATRKPILPPRPVIDDKTFEERAKVVAELYRTGATTNLSKTVCQVFGCSVQSSSKTESTYQRALREVNKHLPQGAQFRQDDGGVAPASHPVTGRRTPA